MENRGNNPSVRSSLLSIKTLFPRFENRNNRSAEPCHICGDVGLEKFIMTCFNCREVREHIYCAKICLQSAPDMWLCQVCRSSTRVLYISNLVDSDMKALKTGNGASSSESSSKFSGKRSSYTSPSKKRQPEFLAFPSPKRKRRTLRLPDTVETDDEGLHSSYPCVFHRID